MASEQKVTKRIRIHPVPVSRIKENPLNKEIFNRLPPEKFEALKDYIRRKGVLKPLILNENGVLLSGHERLAICRELGFRNVPAQTLAFTSKSAEEEFLINDNLLTRDLTPIEIGRAGMHLERMSQKYQRRGRPLRSVIAQTLGISSFTFVKLKAIIGSSDPQLITKVDKQDLSVSRAYSILRQRRQEKKIQKISRSESPRFRLINEDPMAVLGNFKPESCHVIISDPPQDYNQAWTDLAYRAIVRGGSLFIQAQKSLSVIQDAVNSGFSLVAPICVLGKTHQDGIFIWNHRILAWMNKSPGCKILNGQKISTVWDFRSAQDAMLEMYLRILNVATEASDIIVHLFGDNAPIVKASKTLGRHVFAVQPDREKYYREKLDA